MEGNVLRNTLLAVLSRGLLSSDGRASEVHFFSPNAAFY